MKKSGEHVRVNFGQSPFVFDIDGMMAASHFNFFNFLISMGANNQNSTVLRLNISPLRPIKYPPRNDRTLEPTWTPMAQNNERTWQHIANISLLTQIEKKQIALQIEATRYVF